jgi:hypothetical protein
MGLSVTTSLTIFPKDAAGNISQSARNADSIYLAWALSNDLPSQSLTLTFPGAILFGLDLIRANGLVAWSWTPPAPKPDWSVTVPPGPTMPFKIPIMPAPDPNVVPNQVPLIRLASECANAGIPAPEDLALRFTALSTPTPFVSTVALWR